MTNKSIELEGYGKLILFPISIKDRQYEIVDSEGNPLKKIMVGKKAKTVYKTKEGAEIPQRLTCRRMIIDDEELIVGKMMPTKRVEKEDIEIIDDNTMMYDAIEKKIYNIFSTSKPLKKLILEENKSLKIGAIILGLGYKAHEGLLTRYQDRIILVCCRGKLSEALKIYKDEEVTLELDAIEDKEKAKKLLKAITV